MLVGPSGLHTPSARMFHPQENKMSQQASLAKKGSHSTVPMQKGSIQDGKQGEATKVKSRNAASKYRHIGTVSGNPKFSRICRNELLLLH